MISKKQSEEYYLNLYAKELREIADFDYISARTLVKNNLIGESMMLAWQAIEKYFKSLLLFNKIKIQGKSKKIRGIHDLEILYDLCKKNNLLKTNFTREQKEFLYSINNFQDFRYGLKSYCADKKYLELLDETIYDIRFNLYQSPNDMGLLEKILNKNFQHSSVWAIYRNNLIWHNMKFSYKRRHRKKPIVKNNFTEGCTGFFHSLTEVEFQKAKSLIKRYIFISNKYKRKTGKLNKISKK